LSIIKTPKRSLTRLVALTTACLMAWPSLAHTPAGGRAATDASLPALGDVNSQDLSPGAERRLGDRIMRSLLRDPAVTDDPLVLEYVDDLWRSLLVSARQRGDLSADLDADFAWRTFLIKERSVNAFALPGGYIGVHLGLLSVTRSPDELASVLAHELTHVTQRHIARMMGQSKQTSWVGLASMVLGALAMSRSPQAGQALIMGGQGLAVQGQLNFSRDMEREADRIGFGVLADAGYAPAGMGRMFEQLQRASRLNDDGSYPYLRSHPLTTERIGEARARMGSDGLSLGLPEPASRTERLQVLVLRHALMSARARVLMDTRAASLQAWLLPQTVSTDPHAPLAQAYARLVAAIELRDRAQVDAALPALKAALGTLEGAPQREARRVVQLAELDALTATSRSVQAQALINGPVASAPSSGALRAQARPEVMQRARTALNLPDARDNREALQDAAAGLQAVVADRPDDAAAWTLLAGVWQRLNQPLRAVRAEAEAAAATGDLQGAIDRVEAARRRVPQPQAADLIELSVMDARVQRWRQTQRDDAREDTL